jgi:hypothetical protein
MLLYFSGLVRTTENICSGMTETFDPRYFLFFNRVNFYFHGQPHAIFKLLTIYGMNPFA